MKSRLHPRLIELFARAEPNTLSQWLEYNGYCISYGFSEYDDEWSAGQLKLSVRLFNADGSNCCYEVDVDGLSNPKLLEPFPKRQQKPLPSAVYRPAPIDLSGLSVEEIG